MRELYASRSATLSGCFIAIMMVKVLNAHTHCSMCSIVFDCFSLSFPERASSRVGSAAPSLDGSNSSIATNSRFHILSASLRGTGGDAAPTITVSEEAGSEYDSSGMPARPPIESELVVAGVVIGVMPDDTTLIPCRDESGGLTPIIMLVDGTVVAGGTCPPTLLAEAVTMGGACPPALAGITFAEPNPPVNCVACPSLLATTSSTDCSILAWSCVKLVCTAWLMAGIS